MVYLIKEVKYSEIDKLLKLGFDIHQPSKLTTIPNNLIVDLSRAVIKLTPCTSKTKELDWELVEDKYFTLKESTFEERLDYARIYLDGYAADEGFWEQFYSTYSEQTFYAVKGKLKYDTI